MSTSTDRDTSESGGSNWEIACDRAAKLIDERKFREGLVWIDNADFKTVLLRHYPELADTGLANVQDAFEPWDTDERLDPNRHPHRAYIKELKADPWRGDRFR